MTAETPPPLALDAWRAHAGRPASAAAFDRCLSAGTLPQFAARAARRRPGTLAVVVDDDAVTFGQLDDGARRLATRLTASLADRRAGTSPRVLLAMPSSVAFCVGYLAVLYAGGSAVLANATLTAAELASLVGATGPVAALAAGERVDQLHELGVEPVVDLCGTRGTTFDLSSWAPCAVPSSDPGATAHVACTSGTTGSPKVVPLSHRNVLSSVRAVLLAWRWQRRDVLVHPLPLQHGHGLSGFHAALVAGTTTAVLSSFDAERLARLAELHHATVLFSVPSIYEALLGEGTLEEPALRALRLATSGSAPLPPQTSDAVADALGQRPLERYGLTETGFVLSNLYENRRSGSVGLPLPGAEVRVVGEEGTDAEAGATGEIWVRAPQVFSGYDAGGGRRPSREGFVGDGTWFATGDLGTVDASGVFAVTGRKKDVIISGGLNVSPVEVELVLAGLPGVLEAAVVGVPSRRWGEEVTAFVVPAPGGGPDIDELRRAVAERLAPYKRPKTYHLVAELPRDQVGKVRRRDLLAHPRD